MILVLFVFTTTFWTFFELAGSAITLFTDRNVDRHVSFLNDPIPTSAFQAINPFFIILLAPLFSLMWEKLGKKDKDPSTTIKFGSALLQLGFGFALLVLGAKLAGPESM